MKKINFIYNKQLEELRIKELKKKQKIEEKLEKRRNIRSYKRRFFQKEQRNWNSKWQKQKKEKLARLYGKVRQ